MKEELIIKPPESQRIKSRRIILKPGEEVGRHLTDDKEEIIVVLAGQATIICQDKKFTLKPKEACFIAEGIEHNIINQSQKNLEYVYVVGIIK